MKDEASRFLLFAAKLSGDLVRMGFGSVLGFLAMDIDFLSW